MTKRFGEVVAVDDLELDVADREFLVLLGPSGCGKSTVLRMVAGLDEPTTGAIRIGGTRVDGVDPKDRDLAMVFQSYALYPHKTVRQNIEFPLKSRDVPKAERAGLVDDVARSLGLAALLDRKPGQLSGGQRQRVALARAIVRRPAVFLMDEPLSNLDAKMRAATRAELVELHGRLGTTILYVTHDQVEAMTMGDRVAILDAGALQQVGPPQEVYDRPASVFVAQFVGSPPMNVVPGRLVDEGERRLVAVGGERVELPAALARAAASASGPDVHLGVRPEHLRVAEGGLPARLRVAESLGHERHLLCQLATGELVVARVAGEETVPRDGSDLHLAPAPGGLHLFDGATGRRLEP